MPKPADYNKFFSVYLQQDFPEDKVDASLDCPFCNKEKHFQANRTTGLWHCYRCDEGGNPYTLITKIHELFFPDTTYEQYELLSSIRGIAPDILERAGFAYDALNDRWLVPFYTYDPDLQDFSPFLNNLGYFYPSSTDPKSQYVIKKAGVLPSYLYNPGLHEWYPVSNRCILEEGEWDTLAHYDAHRDTTHLVLGKPGSGFPAAALKTISECTEVELRLDNDPAGQLQTAKAIELLSRNKPGVRIFNREWSLIDQNKWTNPISRKPPKDTRDMWTHPTHKEDLVIDTQNAIVEVTESSVDTSTLSAGYVKDATKFPVITSFGKYMDEMSKINLYGATTVKSIAACHAITTSIRIPGRPLWAFIKGPGSSGKTEFLESLGGNNQWFDYQSRLTSEMLVSGWVDDNPDSASYLGEVTDKTVSVKDFTPNLTGTLEQRMKLFGLLTDIYDGSLKIRFGNRRQEEYHNINFNMLCGVTDLIEAHSSASIGERFLRIDWLGHEIDSREYLRRAMDNFGHTNENKIRFTELTLGFTKHLRELPLDLSIPSMYCEGLIDLADFIATIRTKVETNRYEGMLYRPRAEMPMRVGLQLRKLYTGARMVMGTDEFAFDITRKVALDTCYGFPLDVVNFILKNPRCSREQISEGINVHSQRCYRVISDLVTTRVLKAEQITSVRANGRPRHYFSVNPRLLPALQPDKYMDDRTNPYEPITIHSYDATTLEYLEDENQHNRERRPNQSNNRILPRRSTTPKRFTNVSNQPSIN